MDLIRWNGWLTKAQLAGLQALAVKDGKSPAAILRLALDRYLKARKVVVEEK